MAERGRYDAVIVGSGPNGLAAAITLARERLKVLVIEAADQIGGGTRSAELTLPGFVHDVCSAIHPLGAGSPFFRSLPLEQHGLEWIHAPAPLAHPLDDGTAITLERSVERTAEGLGADARAYTRLMAPMVRHWEVLAEEVLAPPHVFRHPLAVARFGLRAIRSTSSLARSKFQGVRARALFAGLSAHSMVPLESLMTASFGLMLGLTGHAVGWPFPRGGSQKIADATAGYLKSLGGEIITGMRIERLNEAPHARTVLLDVTPRQLLQIAGDRLPVGYKRKLERYRYGPGVFKIDYALDGPIPWKSAMCARAATVHLGGTLEEIEASEQSMWNGEPSAKPFVLVAQQSLFDATRAPAGRHTGWTYCHVPHGSDFDMTERIESQIERFAPGFRDRVLARHVMAPAALEQSNANYVGGDIGGGSNEARQLLTRPFLKLDPYATPADGIYLCSSSTPPGAGVHGMCGYYAARSALQRV